MCWFLTHVEPTKYYMTLCIILCQNNHFSCKYSETTKQICDITRNFFAIVKIIVILALGIFQDFSFT